MKKTIIIIAVTSTLSGCLGSSTVTPTMSAPSGTTYQKLSSTAAATSELGGDTLRMNGTNNGLSLETVSGELTHNTKRHTFRDGIINLTDNNGFNVAALPTLEDETDLTLKISSPTTDDQGITGTYDYVRLYENNYTDPNNNDSIENVGYFGVVTGTADVPSTGLAVYTGGAAGITQNTNTGQMLDLYGTSTVAVDFDKKIVVATISGITAKTTGEIPTDAAINVDTITASMGIEGNRFKGTDILTTNDGTAVNLTGLNTASTTQGTFFGYDTAKSIPDEVAGIILTKGDDGYVAINYISD